MAIALEDVTPVRRGLSARAIRRHASRLNWRLILACVNALVWLVIFLTVGHALSVS